MPVSPGSWTSATQLVPFERVRIKRSGRQQSVAQYSKPRDSMQNPQMFEGAGNFNKSGDNS